MPLYQETTLLNKLGDKLHMKINLIYLLILENFKNITYKLKEDKKVFPF